MAAKCSGMAAWRQHRKREQRRKSSSTLWRNRSNIKRQRENGGNKYQRSSKRAAWHGIISNILWQRINGSGGSNIIEI